MLDNDKIYEIINRSLDIQESLPNGTKEILNASFIFNPLQSLSVAKSSYIKHELDWYLSMDRCIHGHEGIEKNHVWGNCAACNGNVNSNYGWCIFSKENFKQYDHALHALLLDPCTRQSCCIYTRPSIQNEHADGINANHDFICTFATQHFIRNNKLQYIVYMRSNDIRFGLPYDLAWHQYVYKKMHNDLTDAGQRTDNEILKNIEVGNIYWNAGSLHRYECQS